MAITDLQAAQEMATKYPELHESRQIAFGENYLKDLEQGTGTSQYYTGFGLAPDWVTGAIGAPAEAPIVQEPTAGDAQVAEQIAEGDRGITGASAIQPTISDPFLASGAAGGARLPTMDQAGAVAAITQPEAYNIPGTMPQTPVSGAWGPQEYLQPQGPRVELPSGDVFAADDPMLQEKMDYTQQDEGFWDDVKNTFNTEGLSGVVTNFGQSVADTLSTLKDQGIDISKMAAGAIMNAIKPGLGLAARLIPETSPIDKFYNQYQVGGDFYEDIVEDDPKFEKRLEGYSDTLQAGTIDQDPFGKNTTSALGDYPAYATKTYNDIVDKEKAGKELSQFDKDRKEYYGHISGLTGETNIPGTPLMVGDPVYGDYGDEDKITPPIDDFDFQTRFKTRGADGVWRGPMEHKRYLEGIEADKATADTETAVTGIEGPPSEIYRDQIMDIAAEQAAKENALQEELEAYRDPIMDMVEPTGEINVEDLTTGEGPYSITAAPDLPDQTGIIPEAPNIFDRGEPIQGGTLEAKNMDEIIQQAEYEDAVRRAEIDRQNREKEAWEAAAQRAADAEAEQRVRAREEAAQRDREEAAERAAAQQAAAQQAAANAAAAQAVSRYRDTAGYEGSGGSAQGGGGGPPGGEGSWKGSRGGRVRYSKGGIVDLL